MQYQEQDQHQHQPQDQHHYALVTCRIKQISVIHQSLSATIDLLSRNPSLRRFTEYLLSRSDTPPVKRQVTPHQSFTPVRYRLTAKATNCRSRRIILAARLFFFARSRRCCSGPVAKSHAAVVHYSFIEPVFTRRIVLAHSHQRATRAWNFAARP